MPWRRTQSTALVIIESSRGHRSKHALSNVNTISVPTRSPLPLGTTYDPPGRLLAQQNPCLASFLYALRCPSFVIPSNPDIPVPFTAASINPPILPSAPSHSYPPQSWLEQSPLLQSHPTLIPLCSTALRRKCRPCLAAHSIPSASAIPFHPSRKPNLPLSHICRHPLQTSWHLNPHGGHPPLVHLLHLHQMALLSPMGLHPSRL